MKLKVKKSYTFRILFYIELYSILVLSGSAFISVQEHDFIRPYLNLLINLIALFFLAASLRCFRKYCSHLFGILGVLIFYTIIQGLNYTPSALDLAEDMLSFFLFVTMIIGLERMRVDYEKAIYKVIYIISFLSLVMYIAVVILNINIPYTEFGQSEEIYYRSYLMLYSWTHRYVRPWNSFNRITSMFWEPGVYAIYLNYALYYLLYRKSYEKKDKLAIAIICINVLLTVSTSGWILTLILLAFRLINNTRYRKIAYIPMVMIVIPIIVQVLSLKQSSNAVSYSLRTTDLIEGLRLFVNNPILGVGYENVGAYSAAQNMSRGNSNGLINWLYQNGLAGTIIMVIPFIMVYKKLQMKSDIRTFNFFVITYLICNLTEPLITRPFNRLILSIVLFKAISSGRKGYGKLKKQTNINDCTKVL